jgi:D-alanyl-D-alanine carboxypeptidase (penicillin-binding protein 5/6)
MALVLLIVAASAAWVMSRVGVGLVQEAPIRAVLRSPQAPLPGPAALSAEPFPSRTSPTTPAVHAPTAILINLSTGRVVFSKHPDLRRPVASLTKILTAMVVLERANLSDVVVVSRKAARTPPIDVGLRAKERISVRDLLYGLLLWSGNDTAVALAEHVSGHVAPFVRVMNDRARVLGLRNTYFASPNGLNDRGYSTARDLAVLTRAALADPTFARIVRTERRWIPGPKTQLHRLRNLNELLRTYRGALGVKTGYTSAAGNCLVGAAERDGHRLLAVVLGDPAGTHWVFAYRDARRLLDYGFKLLGGAPPAVR